MLKKFIVLLTAAFCLCAMTTAVATAGYPKLANYYLKLFLSAEEVTDLQKWDAYVLPLEDLDSVYWDDALYNQPTYFYQDSTQVVVWNGDLNAGPSGSSSIGALQHDLFSKVDDGADHWWLLGVGSELTGAVSASDTVIPVTDARQFQYVTSANELRNFAGLMVDSEHMFISSVDTNTNEITVTRGHSEGIFTPASHLAGAEVRPHIEFWVYRNEADDALMVDWMIDSTDACPVKTIEGTPYRWNTYIPQWMENQLASEPDNTGIYWDDVWDGISGLNRHPDTLLPHVDADRDGLPDDADELDLSWVQGMKTIFAQSGALQPLRPIQGNMQRFLPGYYPYLDGMLTESFQSFWEGDASPWSKYATLAYGVHRLPNFISVNVSTELNDYAAFRYNLAFALLTGAYFSLDVGPTDHGQQIWRDEYGGGDNSGVTHLGQEYLGDPSGAAWPAGYHGPNVVECFDFICEDGWTRNAADPASADFSIVSGPATTGSNAQRITVNYTTSPDYAINLQQGNLSLVAEKRYALSFFAKADATKTIYTTVRENGYEYDSLLGRSVEIGTAWKVYILPFHTISCPAVTLDDMKVEFDLGAATGSVDISRVRILNEDGDAPMDWAASLTQKADWDQSKALATILNGDFDAVDPWDHWTKYDPNSKANWQIVSGPNGSDNAAQIQVQEIVSPNYNVQIYQDNIQLLPEKQYIFSFYARSSTRRSIYAGVSLFHTPWTDYGGKTFYLTSLWQRYSMVTSTAGVLEENLDNIKLGFALGDAASDVEIAHVSVAEFSSDAWLPNLVRDRTYQDQWKQWILTESAAGLANWTITAGIQASENATRITIPSAQAGQYAYLQQEKLTLAANRQYLVMIWARSSGHHTVRGDLSNYGSSWVSFNSCGSTAENCGLASAPVDTQWQPIIFTAGSYGFSADNLTNPTLTISVSGEEGWVEITRAAVIEAGPMVYARTFAEGQVLVNMTEWPAFVWLDESRWKINGSEDPTHNSGDYVGFLTMDSSDAYILTDTYPSAVDLIEFSATRISEGIELQWLTGTELMCGAFTILRCALSDGATDCRLDEHVELDMILPCANDSNGAEYSTVDNEAEAFIAYSYYLREYETTGNVRDYGPFLISAGRENIGWTRHEISAVSHHDGNHNAGNDFADVAFAKSRTGAFDRDYTDDDDDDDSDEYHVAPLSDSDEDGYIGGCGGR